MKKPPIDITSRPAKYYLAKKQGANKREALKIAGYGNGNQSSQVEQSKAYKEIKEYFSDHLLKEISLKDIAKELKKNIVQDNDRGAKNTAIKLALDKIEPEDRIKDNDDDIVVILRPVKTIEGDISIE